MGIRKDSHGVLHFWTRKKGTMNQPKEWYDEFHVEEGFAAAADELAPPSQEEQVWIATTRRPLTGHKPQMVIARAEAQAKAVLLKYWRRVNVRPRRLSRGLPWPGISGA